MNIEYLILNDNLNVEFEKFWKEHFTFFPELPLDKEQLVLWRSFTKRVFERIYRTAIENYQNGLEEGRDITWKEMEAKIEGVKTKITHSVKEILSELS